MAEGYYCIRCNKFVLVNQGIFLHPHAGQQSCRVCYRCGGMVYLREQEEKHAV